MEITAVRRQRATWQQEAPGSWRRDAQHRNWDAMHKTGRVLEHATQDVAKASVIAQWDAARRTNPDQSHETSIRRARPPPQWTDVGCSFAGSGGSALADDCLTSLGVAP